MYVRHVRGLIHVGYTRVRERALCLRQASMDQCSLCSSVCVSPVLLLSVGRSLVLCASRVWARNHGASGSECKVGWGWERLQDTHVLSLSERRLKKEGVHVDVSSFPLFHTIDV